MSFENPLFDSLSFTDTNDEDDGALSTIILYGGTPRSNIERNNGRRLMIDAFYVTDDDSVVVLGEACSLEGATVLVPHEMYPLTVFPLLKEQRKIVFACQNSVIVGIAEFEYSALLEAVHS